VSNESTKTTPLWALDENRAPAVDPSAWIAHSATAVGRVDIHALTSIWYGAVIRAEAEPIVIGEGSNLQDGVKAHVDPGYPLKIGNNVTIGHNAVVHGCTIADNCLIGMGAILMNGVTIGEESLIAAGALVTEGTHVPPRSLVAGVPAKVRRELTQDEIQHCKSSAASYRDLMHQHGRAQQVNVDQVH
jgi:carbonic anhydrase/acetyltransferase-like protein (isoleucine patch superfamily)